MHWLAKASQQQTVDHLLLCPCRRAEAEADLIGLKLMAIAGYNPNKAPQTFAKMEEYQVPVVGVCVCVCDGGGGGG